MSSTTYLLAIGIAFAIASTYAAPDEQSTPLVEEALVGEEDISSTTAKSTTGFQYGLEPLTIPGGCSNDTDIIDERQRGDENYRVSLNGVRIIVAPPNSLMGSLLGDMKKPGNTAATDGNKDKPSIGLHAEKQRKRLHVSLPWLLKNLNFRRPEVKE